MKLRLIACEILYREFSAAIARSVNRVDMESLPKGLHDAGQAAMSGRLREVLAQVDPAEYDAVLFGYGLCSNGVVGLAAGRVPLVIPRAHDCITLFLGSKERYLDYFQNNPGVYFKTTGWLERGAGINQLGSEAGKNPGLQCSLEELTAKYGEDNARFLYEQLGDLTRHYRQFTFIRMGIEPDDRFERQAREEAASRGWKYECLDGDLGLIQRLLDGPWNEEEFLVVEPGYRVAPSFDEKVIKAEKIE